MRQSAKHPDEYVRPPKCEVCGSVKMVMRGKKKIERKYGWRIEGQYEKREVCRCNNVVGKGGAFPHKKGEHAMCDHHPNGPYNQAKRAGIKDDDIPLEHMGRKMKNSDPCPF
jgi:hypothetical protein